MESITTNLTAIDILVREMVLVYEDVLSAMVSLQQAFLSGDCARTSTLGTELERLHSLAGKIEQQRLQRVSAITSHQKIESPSLTLKNLEDIADKLGEVGISRSLGDSGTKLAAVLARISEISSENRLLVERRLRYTRFMLGVMAKSSGYTSSGTSQAPNLSRLSVRA